MRLGLLLIFVFVFTKLAFSAKEISLPQWTRIEYRDSVYPSENYFLQFLMWENIKSREAEEQKDAIIKDLKKRLTQHIITRVSSESIIEKSEDNSNYEESFTNKTSFISEVNLFETKPMTFYDHENNTMYGLVVVNKKTLGNHYLKIITSKAKVLVNELNWYNTNATAKSIQKDINSYNKRVDQLEQNYQIIIASGFESTNDITDQLALIRSKINELYNVLHSSENEELIQEAQKFLLSGNYKDALDRFKVAMIKLPEDARIINGIRESKKRLEQQLIDKANNYSNKQEYNRALLQYQALFNLIPEAKTFYTKEYQSLVEKSFDQFAEELDFALKHKDIPEITKALNQLKEYQHVDRDEYNRYFEKVNTARAQDLYQQAKIKYNDGEFLQSISKINQAIAIDSDKSYLDIKKRAEKRLYRIDLKNLKKQRPHLYALQLGFGVQNQQSLLQVYQETNEFDYQLYPSLQLGLYRKFGINENVWSNGRDKSRAKLLGLRYNYLLTDFYYASSLVNNGVGGIHETQFCIGLSNNFMFTLGAASSTLSFEKFQTQYLISGITTLIYMRPLVMGVELNAYVDKNSVYPIAKVSVMFNTNLKREITKKDKTKLRYHINN